MQKIKVSACGDHLYTDPVETPLLFVLLFPPSTTTMRKLQRIALANGYNGHAVTWIHSARVTSRKALLRIHPPKMRTTTHADKLQASVGMAKVVVAAWGALPHGQRFVFRGDLLCMGHDAHGNPLCPVLGAPFVRY